VTLKHKILHDKPTEVATPSEVKQEINENLHLSPVELRYHLRKKFDISNITSKQIYYWWSYFTQQFYKTDENHVISTCIFFDKQSNNYYDHCFQLDTDNITAIGFTTCLLEGLRTKALTDFFYTFRNKGLNPSYFYTDKDFAEITAAKNIWLLTNIQLCLWHIEKAFKEKLISCKKIMYTNYKYEEVIKEFTFIDPSFIPDLQRTDNEYYI
ncbi:366_t:CDS:2, partial [Racocetra fulgida]